MLELPLELTPIPCLIFLESLSLYGIQTAGPPTISTDYDSKSQTKIFGEFHFNFLHFSDKDLGEISF